MISRLSVKNFQSIAKADLDLGRFTVIVGPSSSGKSALLRAIRLLASNARGASFVRHGERTAVVSALVDGTTVTLTRGDGVGEYRVEKDGAVSAYTKLGGAVPEEISGLLGIKSKDPLHFAGQFDRPFLLDETGSEVARVLGDLTGVSLIFGAAREASRRRQGTNTLLRAKVGDKDRLTGRLEAFRALPGQVKAQGEAEHALAKAQAVKAQADRLASLVTDLRVAEAALATVSAVSVTIPDFEPVATARDRLAAFKALVAEIGSYNRAIPALQRDIEAETREIERLEAVYHGLLEEAGTCPVCGQSTRELQPA